MLKRLIDNKKSDKDTVHTYLEVYELIFARIKESAKNVLEIGILYGGSIDMWNKYFENANIYAIDSEPLLPEALFLVNTPRVNILTPVNAYDTDLVRLFQHQNIQMDVIVDDGPHTLESMQFVVKHYSSLLSTNGILVIEDVQDYSWISKIYEEVPENLKKYVFVVDRRVLKGRYDDVMFIINKAHAN